VRDFPTGARAAPLLARGKKAKVFLQTQSYSLESRGTATAEDSKVDKLPLTRGQVGGGKPIELDGTRAKERPESRDLQFRSSRFFLPDFALTPARGQKSQTD
jgi:hypothetical protein